jgi:hypothetical protein
VKVAETGTDMGFRIAAGCVGGAIVGVAAILLLSPHIRSLKALPADAALCQTIWDRFVTAGDLVELERNKFLLDRTHCDVRQMLARAAPRS